jgi:hypothetical protein
LSRALATVAAAIFVFGASMATAQTGKVHVKILDGKTKEPLQGATIKIVETKQGALTKENGEATIIAVPPSENYTIVAKYAGYEPDTLRHVKIFSDQTKELKFTLGAKNVEIVVNAEKLVDPHKNELSTQLQATQIQSIGGRQRLDQVIMLTPGLVQDNTNGGFSGKGSRGDQNSVKVNGIEITDPLTGKSSTLQNSMSRLAISEVDVVTGNAGADKGGFTGGQINTQTRQGSANLEVQAHWRGELPTLWGSSSNGYKQMGAGENTYEFLVSGPLFGDAVKFTITGKDDAFKYYNWYSDPSYDNEGLGVFDPLGNNTGQLPHDSRWRTFGSGKLTFDLAGFSTSLDGLVSQENILINSTGLMYMDPYYLPASSTIENVFSLNSRGQIGDGVLEFTAGYHTYNSQTGKYDQAQSVDAFHAPHFLSIDDKYTWDDQSQTYELKPDGIIDVFTPVSKQIPNPSSPTQPYGNSIPGINPFTGHSEGPSTAYTTNNAYGLPQLFPSVGNVTGISLQKLRTNDFTLQYSNQIGAHYISGGVSGTLMSLYNYSNGLPWDANPFKDSFDVHPYLGAVNISDKMEFSDITFNPGLRFDIYQPNSRTINDLYNPLNSGTTATKLQSQLSPRLAITYAVTEQTTFDFGYNWYFKQPSLISALTNAASSASILQQALIRGNTIIGNGGLDAERTREVQVGFQTQLSDLVAVSVHGTYKDLRNDVGLQRISSPLLANGFLLFSSDQYGNARSIEFVFEKRMADNYSVKFDYTYGSAKGTSTSATENFESLINADPNSEQAVLPLTPFPLSFDKPHTAHLLLNINYNKGEGPTIFGTKLLQYFSLATTTEYTSGTPYTRLDLRGAQIGDFNGDRNPDYFQSDITLTRTVPFEDLFGSTFKTMFLDLQLEVVNLFNRTEPIFVYPTSGQGDNDGRNHLWGGSFDYVNDPVNGPLDALGKPLYNPVIAKHDANGRPADVVTVADQQVAYESYISNIFARRTNYQTPRRVYLNATVRF